MSGNKDEIKLTIGIPSVIEVEIPENRMERIWRKIRFFKDESPYVCLRYTKHVAIFNNRQGIIQNLATFIINKKFERIYYEFALGKSAHKDITFKPLNEMLESYKKDPNNRFSDQTFRINGVRNLLRHFMI